MSDSVDIQEDSTSMVFKIPMIVQIMLDMLDTKSLLHARGTCQLFNEEAEKLLVRRERQRAESTEPAYPRRTYLFQKGFQRYLNSTLNEELLFSKIGQSLDYREYNDSQDVQQFQTQYGSRFKHLSLKVSHKFCPRTLFALLEKFPNIETLRMTFNCPEVGDCTHVDQISELPCTFESLTHLEFRLTVDKVVEMPSEVLWNVYRKIGTASQVGLNVDTYNDLFACYFLLKMIRIHGPNYFSMNQYIHFSNLTVVEKTVCMMEWLKPGLNDEHQTWEDYGGLANLQAAGFL